MAISVASISAEQAAKVLSLEEGHFADVKAIEIAPSRRAGHGQAESMEKKGLVEKVPGTTQATTAYRKGPEFLNWRAKVVGSERRSDGA